MGCARVQSLAAMWGQQADGLPQLAERRSAGTGLGATLRAGPQQLGAASWLVLGGGTSSWLFFYFLNFGF